LWKLPRFDISHTSHFHPLFSFVLINQPPSGSKRGVIPQEIALTDILGGFIGLTGFILWASSAYHYEHGKAWNLGAHTTRDKTIGEHKRDASLMATQTQLASFGDQLNLSLPRSEDSMNSTMGASTISDETREWKLDDGFFGKMNPYLWIRYPVQMSWVLLWISFWCTSWVVYPYYFVGFATIVSPAVAIIWDLFVVVPLLDNFYDDLHGKKQEYRTYRDETPRFWCF